ncbi:MAG: hypothetical protein PHX51_03390 [Clostridia bacterium]|nr:hypothetical protein [Clostridia bacterium]
MFILLPIVFRIDGDARLNGANVYLRLVLFNLIPLAKAKLHFSREGVRLRFFGERLIPYSKIKLSGKRSMKSYGLKIRGITVSLAVNVLENVQRLVLIQTACAGAVAAAELAKPRGMRIRANYNLTLAPTGARFCVVIEFSIIRLFITLLSGKK